MGGRWRAGGGGGGGRGEPSKVQLKTEDLTPRFSPMPTDGHRTILRLFPAMA